MKNTFNKLTQSLFEAFKGPRTKDFEYEKMTQEYQIGKEHILSLKNVIDNYPSSLESYKLTINLLVSNLEIIFDKDKGTYFKFISNVASAHKALNDKLVSMFSKIEQLKSSISRWTENCISVDTKIALREEKRKNFDHYDEKMAEMLEERNKIILKGKIPNEKDDEKYVRNIKKYQLAAKDYIGATNDAYKHMCFLLDSRYENISNGIIDFIEIEAAFFNEASYIFNFFKNCRNNMMAMRQNFIPTKREYEASNFIRGKSLLNINVEEMMKNSTTISGVIEGKPELSKKSSINNDMIRSKTINQNQNNFNQNRTNTLFNPYGNNDNSTKNNYYKPNPYNKNTFDNSIPDPFTNEQDLGALNPYGNNEQLTDSNSTKFNENPYNQGANLGDNPFDHPNV